MSIIIFSRPVHTGKTTELLQWCRQQENVAGILMPVIEGKRKIQDIVTGEILDIVCEDPGRTKEAVVNVGPYFFFRAVFEEVNRALAGKLLDKPKWLVIDEVGKLELEGKGFHDALKTIIDEHENKMTESDILLVVRECLCDRVPAFYKLSNYRVVHNLDAI